MSSVTDADGARRLEAKTAVVFGAGGEVGGAVAKELAAHGAQVFLSGRTKNRVQDLAEAISSRGGTAAAAEVDALDEDAVTSYLDDVVADAGRIDIMFNAMGPQAVEYRNATSTMELPVEAFMLPITTIVRSQFITARAAARPFTKVGSGVIVFLTATPSQGLANTSAIGAAYGAIESLTRSLAIDLGASGVRVVCVRSMLMAETRVGRQTIDMGAAAMGMPKEKMAEIITSRPLLRRSPTVADTAKLVAFVASEEASTLTGAIVNSSCGLVLD
jgi:NAD(P)-dependent dehydrogenase (short-subunit alcohol dehydrogenase family)